MDSRGKPTEVHQALRHVSQYFTTIYSYRRPRQVCRELLAHRWDPPPSSSLAERTPPLAPPPCGGARFPTLAATGLTDVDLRSRRFQRLFHGLYIRSGSKIGVHQMAAAALHISPPGSFASHETAAALWGSSSATSMRSTSAFRRDHRDRSGGASLPIAPEATRIPALTEDRSSPTPPASSRR